jgi:hypothetical protein
VWEALGEYAGPPNIRILVRYIAARMYRDAVTTSYRAYVTASLRLIPQMSYLSRGWLESVKDAKRPKRERTAEEIVDDVVSRLEGGAR